MSGASDYAAGLLGRWITGQQDMPAAPTVWMALFATLPSDSNVGGVELNGNGYGRAQVSGQLNVLADVANGTMLTFAAVPAWIAVGMSVSDLTNEDAIVSGQTVAAVDLVANTVTLSGGIDAQVTADDVISFSAFGGPTGSAPSIFSNIGPIVFPLTTGPGPGTANGWGFFDAQTGGNLLIADVVAGGSAVIAGNVTATFAAGQLVLSVT